MSRLRFIAIGSVGVASSLLYYLQDGNLSNITAKCKSLNLYENRENSSEFTTRPWNRNWDLREPSPIERSTYDISNDGNEPTKKQKEVPTATRHVILIRHGQYVYGDTDDLCVLTDLGRKQAILTGERLKSLGINFDKMVISTMTRAQETGELISKSLPDINTEHCSLLREGKPYPYEPSSHNSRSYKWQAATFIDNPRIEGAFRKYIHRADPQQEEDSYELLICHGNVIRYFICRALQFPPEGWLRMSVAHCGITWLSIRPSGNVSVTAIGSSGHLPGEMVTTS